MALDLQGLDNSSEFFSHHYLAALLETDLKDRYKQWTQAEKEGGPKAPWKKLDRVASRYFPLRAQAAEAPARAVLERLDAAQQVHAHLLSALGIARDPGHVVLDDGRVVPVVAALRQSSKPWLWVVEAPFPVLDGDDAEDPLAATPLAEQLPRATRADLQDHLARDDWRSLLDKTLFAQEHPPRLVLVLAGSTVTLADKHRWGQGRHLTLDLDVLFTRRSRSTLKAVCGLFHREVLAPDAGGTALDALVESSHKQAVSVSGELRHGAREAVELLANEAIFYKRTVAKQKLFGDPALAVQLTRESLTWLYRLLFLFYVEARGAELGVVPMDAESWRLGYSLESLRDYALKPLTTPQAQSGFFLHHSLTRLFGLLNRGWPQDAAPSLLDKADQGDFRLRGVRSELFDDEHTPLLRGVKVRNQVWQRILELLSLTPEGKGPRQRVSYAMLGINQLGSVYEGLLSYSGFFAQDDLIEVKAAKDMGDPDARTFYVPHAHAELYDPAEIVKESGDKWRVHPKGTFLFRLAGRDREKSASYYTPEVLTRCLTKYTLAERLDGLPADDILGLTVCEPAMGSGAFLIEAVDQLADAYLQRKQQERKDAGHPDWQVDPADYPAQKRRVAAHIALHNAYGVDLNPLAGELARLSLWLGSLREDAPAPWFGARLATGNSLVGARLQWYSGKLLRTKDSKKNRDSGVASWLTSPPAAGPRPPSGVYHFLVVEADMAPYDRDKVVKSLPGMADHVAQLKAWKKANKKPYNAKQTARLAEMSDRVDALLARHAQSRRRLLDGVAQAIPVWGQPRPQGRTLSAEECVERLAEHQRTDWAARKLQWAMDYQVALWFWPVEQAETLPTRAELLGDLQFILDGETDPADLLSGATTVVADLDELVEAAQDGALPLFTVKGELEGTAERLEIVRQVARRVRPLHWPLVFPEVFLSDLGEAAPGGFDVVLGNPPWVKVQWNEGGILGDLDPRLVLRRMNAKQKADERKRVLAPEKPGNRAAYLAEFEEMVGLGNYLGSTTNQPLLVGQQTNLYKCFITKAWELLNDSGASGLVHPEGIYDDPKGGTLRRSLYPRLRWHIQFLNYMKLFETVLHKLAYSLNVYGPTRGTAGFSSISNLFHPDTLDRSLAHDGKGEVPGIKTDEGTWDLRGHASRVVNVDDDTLALFAKLYDPPGTPAREARLPVVHSADFVSVLEKTSRATALGETNLWWWGTSDHLDESRQQADGTIKHDPGPVEMLEDWIVSGPHFFVGTPFNKTPNHGCRHNQDYSVLDHELIPDDYLPMSVYRRICTREEFVSRTPDTGKGKLTSHWKFIARRMLPPTGERTLAPALLPPGPSYVGVVFGTVLDNDRHVVQIVGLFSSLVVDYMVRASGVTNLRHRLLQQLPAPIADARVEARTLRLNCLTTHYAPLWAELFDPAWTRDRFTKDDPRLPDWTDLTPEWQRHSALRTPYARRQALVELDALAALALGLSADELCLIYRVQFPVLQGYERETFYDQRGRIVFTVNRGLPGVGLSRKEWREIADAQPGDALPDWATDALGPYQPPFDACDREADMRQAYAEFQRRQAAEETP